MDFDFRRASEGLLIYLASVFALAAIVIPLTLEFAFNAPAWVDLASMGFLLALFGIAPVKWMMGWSINTRYSADLVKAAPVP